MKLQKMEMELQKGVWCGYKSRWSTANSKINYDKLLHSSTNMVNPGVGLDTQSGIYIPVSIYFISVVVKVNQDELERVRR